MYKKLGVSHQLKQGVKIIKLNPGLWNATNCRMQVFYLKQLNMSGGVGLAIFICGVRQFVALMFFL